MRGITKLITGNYELNNFQENVDTFAKQFLQIPIIDGVFLEDVAIGTSDTIIPHKLNRPYKGFFVVLQTVNTNVYESSTANDLKKFNIILKAGSATTVNLWVF